GICYRRVLRGLLRRSSPWSPKPLRTFFLAFRALSAFCERPTSSISLKRPRAVRFAYALALGRRTRSRLPAGLARLVPAGFCAFWAVSPLRLLHAPRQRRRDLTSEAPMTTIIPPIAARR